MPQSGGVKFDQHKTCLRMHCCKSHDMHSYQLMFVGHPFRGLPRMVPIRRSFCCLLDNRGYLPRIGFNTTAAGFLKLCRNAAGCRLPNLGACFFSPRPPTVGPYTTKRQNGDHQKAGFGVGKTKGPSNFDTGRCNSAIGTPFLNGIEAPNLPQCLRHHVYNPQNLVCFVCVL